MAHQTLFISAVALALGLMLIATAAASGESGLGEDTNTTNNGTIIQQDEEETAEESVEECDYDSPLWIEHLYKVHFHTDGKTHLHVGVNVSLKEAVHNDGWAFRQLLIKKQHYQLVEEGECRSGNHITNHAQLHGQVCPWEYTCDYNPRRFPAYIFQAVCKNRYWFGADRKLHKCREVFYPITTLHTSECNPVKSTSSWEWRMEMAAVACA